MAKQSNGRTRSGKKAAGGAGAKTPDAIEQRVVAFAEQLGRIAGSVQAKAEGWMDAKTLEKQIASVRAGATDLLERLASAASAAAKTGAAKSGAAKARTPKAPANARSASATRGGSRSRSGGVVDAPGKKHRTPLPADPGAILAHSQEAKLRAVRPMAKTSRLRGRG